MKVLALEPWYGGSHRNFLDGLVKHIGHKALADGLYGLARHGDGSAVHAPFPKPRRHRDPMKGMPAVFDKPIEKIPMRAAIPGFQRQYVHFFNFGDLKKNLLLPFEFFEEALHFVLFRLGCRAYDGDGAQLEVFPQDRILHLVGGEE